MQFALGSPTCSWYGHSVRATHPFMLLQPLLAAALIAPNPLMAVAADLVFDDGNTGTDVEIVCQLASSLMVLAAGAAETEHEARLTSTCPAALKLRLRYGEDLAHHPNDI